MKTCYRCKGVKAPECFRRQSRASDGLDSWCIRCRTVYDRERRLAKRDEIRAQQREHKRQVRATPEGREASRQARRRYYLKHTDEVKQRVRRYNEANPDKYRAWLADGKRRYRARKANVPHEPYTLAEIAERDEYLCQLCYEPVDMTLPGSDPLGPCLDHDLPISKGGWDDAANISLAHSRCNQRKGTRAVWLIVD